MIERLLQLCIDSCIEYYYFIGIQLTCKYLRNYYAKQFQRGKFGPKLD
jgi:hypothetical protein